MNIKEFASSRGGTSVIIRRHLESRKIKNRTLSPETGLALRLARLMNDHLQGLSSEGTANAFQQGKRLSEMEVIPAFICHGIDQRNIDGAQATVEGLLGETVTLIPCFGSPGLTYPYYNCGELAHVAGLLDRYGDPCVHRHLAGIDDVTNLWTETAGAFAGRMESALVHRREEPQLWDLNFEQMVWYHEHFFGEAQTHQDPYKGTDGEWFDPEYGAGFLVCNDGTVAEFNPSFEVGVGFSGKPKV